MEEVKSARLMNDESRQKVKTHSGASYENGQYNLSHQRVSVKEIIVDHYRRGK
ncbi:hypothetical protein BXY85_2379 [Roseivirga pacifica]|jgi:hypothetical protein|uniref:Uncharacterized protein n=1 Tax=Roseivirga pacifica TaxID=1267423 RepID=A0A1I0NPX1_9BACT|nr:hypothetical protein [Roseivirga pacifica]RKQ51355.1 hypothetical protein BXY85_2379 [Roseivirga pacifica]SEW03270.1 hypothetical protein SAMN05216290_1361 [Roseivirga pacifica]